MLLALIVKLSDSSLNISLNKVSISSCLNYYVFSHKTCLKNKIKQIYIEKKQTNSFLITNNKFQNIQICHFH